MKTIGVLVLVMMLISPMFSRPLWAHGEDKLGPHGGVIRMPGGFHTELKAKGKASLELYLLDIEWKNPSVKDSSASVVWARKGKVEKKLPCEAKGTYFGCSLPKGAELKIGDRVIVRAIRQGMPGAPATYEYPFQPTAMKDQEVHSGH